MSSNTEIVKNGALPGELDRVITRLRETNWDDLAPDKKAFAMAYVQSLSHTEAAMAINKAGRGLKYLRDPLVRALISDVQEEYAKISLINKSMVEAKMLETLEKLEGKVDIPMVTGQGLPIIEKKFHPGETVNLLKEMGRVSGIVPKDHGAEGGVNIQINMGALLGE
jgi:hypothetical protein